MRLHLLEARQRYIGLSAPVVLRRVYDSINRRGQRMDELLLRMDRASARTLRQRGEKLRALQERLRRQDIGLRLAASHRRVDRGTVHLDRAMREAVSRRQGRLDAASARLQALSPLRVLARGYALVYAENGMLLRSSSETAPGQEIRARLASGTLSAKVTATDSTENSNS
jgi:exodeoxyribonuclease VII large subunit